MWFEKLRVNRGINELMYLSFKTKPLQILIFSMLPADYKGSTVSCLYSLNAIIFIDLSNTKMYLHTNNAVCTNI